MSAVSLPRLTRLCAAVAPIGLLLIGATPPTPAAPAAAPAVTAAVAPATPPRTRPVARAGTVIVPDHFLRRWDPVTIFFDHPVGPAQAGPEDDPRRFVQLSPAHPGAYRWLDSRTLQFTPAEAWPPLARYTWSAQGATTSLDTLLSRPTSSLPANNADNLEPLRTITLVFPEPLDVATLRRILTIELAPLPGAAESAGTARRVLGARDFQIKAQERGARSDPATYVISLANAIPAATRAVLHFRLSLSEESLEAALDLSFRTREHFRITALGCGNQQAPIASAGSRYSQEQALRCTGQARRLSLEFSAALSADMSPLTARNLLRFEPAVPGLRFTISGRQILIDGDFTRETLYRASLHLPPIVHDDEGRGLEMHGETEIYFLFPELSGYLRWGASQGIVERLGPQQIPIEGRGFERVDLRIFKIDPLNRTFWPFPAQPVELNEATRPPGPGEEPEPWTNPDQEISNVGISKAILALGSPAISELVNLPLRRAGATAHFGLDLSSELEKMSGKGAPGTYLVGIRRLDSTKRTYMRVQATDLALSEIEEPKSVVFAVTSLSSGSPVTGASVKVEGPIREPGMQGKTSRWATLFEGTTDASGKLNWKVPGHGDSRTASRIRRIVVQQASDLLVLDALFPPDEYIDGQWKTRQNMWLAWTQEELAGRQQPSETLVHIFTERPVYRPEEMVHIKGYIRRREAGHLHALTGKGTVVVNGPGDLEWRLPVTLTPHGSFYHAFKEQKLPTGVYTATYENSAGSAIGKVSFKMEAYRLPRFQVQLHSSDIVPLDREFKVGLLATYYAGGRVTARPLAWRVTQFPYAWTPKKLTGYLYSSDGRFSHTEKFESSPKLERADTTDANGSANLTLNPAIEPTAQPRSYVVEATVTGADDQTVTAARSIIALPPFVLGLKVPRFVDKATHLDPEFVVVGPDDQRISGQKVTVRLLERQWHSHLQASDFSAGVARYRTDVVDQKVSEQVVVSTGVPQKMTLPIPHAGVYVVEIEGRDKLGRTQVVSVDLYASGEQPVTWSKAPAGAFNVVADKSEYKPGETAALVLESPFQHAHALAIVEAPDGNVYSWIEVNGGAATFKMPILGTYTPRVPVHFLLERGRIPGTAPQPGSAADLGKPATVAATTYLKVLPLDNQLQVKLTYPEKARPGQKIEVGIQLADPQGRPLAGEVTLWLVDQAVLALGKEQRLDPLPDFITRVTSHLSLGDTRNLAFGFLPFAENPGGEEKSANGGNILDRVTVRRNFKPVPYFNPGIEVGADGTAHVVVELPDDLTNFEVRAKAAGGEERFGFGVGEIQVRLPVLIQPSLPRFVRPGDRFLALALGRVVEGDGGAGKAEMRATGVEVSGPTQQSITLNAKDPTRVEFPVTVSTPGYTADGKLAAQEVTFRFGVERSSDKAADGAEAKLPIRDDRRRVTVRLLKELASGGSLAVPALPEPARAGTVRRSVLASDQTALVRMATGLDMLIDYPYGCTEQRLSRTRAELALTRLRDLLKQAGDDGRLRSDVATTLEWLGRAVDDHGLVGYWPGSRGYVSLTSWSLEFMVEAKAAGYTVDPKLYDSLGRSLEQALRSDSGRFIDGEAYLERSWALAALTSAGKAQPAYAAELARKAEFLDLEGTAEVVQALGQSGGGADAQPTMAALTKRLWGGLVWRLYNGQSIFGGLQQSPTLAPANGLVLPSETRTVAEITRALRRADGGNPKLGGLVDALTTLGTDDGWGSTNANASALLALSEFLKPPFTSSARSLNVQLGATHQTVALGPEHPVASATWTDANAGQAGALSLPAAAGTAPPLTVRLETSYLPAADGAHVAPAANGLVVSRELLRIHGDAPPEMISIGNGGATQNLAIGDVIEEHVRVVNPKDRHYIAVSVPLAAGMEPLNPELATAPPEARPRGTLSLAPTYAAYLDDSVTFFYDTLPKGTFDFYFRTRGTTAGSFIQPAARAEAMYDASVFGNSAGTRIEVAAAPKAP
jgi:uncharacterized protein YfaS (alpha-2-macroglobulin family)